MEGKQSYTEPTKFNDEEDFISVTTLPQVSSRRRVRAHKKAKASVHLPISTLLADSHRFQKANDDHPEGNVSSDETDDEIDAINQQLVPSQGDTDEEESENRSHYIPKSIMIFSKSWLKYFIQFGLLILICITPGILCKYSAIQCLVISNLSIWDISLFITIAVTSLFIIQVITSLAIYIVEYSESRISYYIKPMRRPVVLFLWSVSLLLIWNLWFRLSLSDSTKEAIKFGEKAIFTGLIMSSIGFSVKVICMRYLAIRFHRGAYINRIRINLIMEYLIEKFYSMSSTLVGTGRASVYMLKHHTGDDSNVKIKYLKVNEKILLHNDFSSHQLADFIEYFKGNATFNAWNGELEENGKLYGKRKAIKIIGENIFKKFQHNAGGAISENDFRLIFKSHQLSKQAFSFFDSNLDGFVSKGEFQAALLLLFKERKALTRALHEGENSIGKLDSVITVLFMVVLILLTMLFLGVDMTGFLVTISSVLVSLSFSCGQSLQRIVDSVQFVFFMHPFDIGDRVMIDGIIYLIHKVNILTTEMITHDNTKVIHPNAKLIHSPIHNFRRSPDQFDITQFEIDYSTSPEKLKELEQRISKFLKYQSMHFYRSYEMEIKEVQGREKMLLRLWIQHRSNFQNMKRFRERRTLAIMNVKAIFEDLQILYKVL
ncbi:hypothetical protein ROZALSC1DRAFT_29597 [Rozella allomycis CSF55]|uniref:Mechanosensitive ion channel MscS domain-containing protein n=1 Tax=Rozella allomycis (strain CSF55) TaxID=988480 RepID=A0A075AWK0_ROZAC|nr:Mechanosensitive ion channel MscS domain-containing protein [Rozella allomycis CSF55]RKP18749.1 hypothetical protein ROZALSC1DRAFT_29597 [Rozella allomycis CSF55]|eukprot:EPZ34705.1 Mechanosensitive ion channel MscS domain-containing protein [Rozella allomycis CSF55]